MPARRIDAQAYEAAGRLLKKEEFDLWEQDAKTLTQKEKKTHRKLCNRICQDISRQKKKQSDQAPGDQGGDDNQAVAQNKEEIAPAAQSRTKKTPNRKQGTSPAVQSCPSSRHLRADPVAPINQFDGKEGKKAVTTSKSKQPLKEEEQNSLSKTRGGGKWLPFKSKQPPTDEEEEEENRADSGGKRRPTEHPRTSHNSGTLANELVQLDPTTTLQAPSSWNVSGDSINNPAFAHQSAAATASVSRASSDVFDSQIPPSVLLSQPPNSYQFSQSSRPTLSLLNTDYQKPKKLSTLTNQTLVQRQQQKAQSEKQARQQQASQQNSHRVPSFFGHPTSAPASQNTEYLFCPTASLPLQAPELQSFPTNGSTSSPVYRTSSVHIMPPTHTPATLPLDLGFSLPLQ